MNVPAPRPANAAKHVSCETEGKAWSEANAQLDAAARALLEGRYIDALRLGRVAAAKLRDAAGPDHPAHARLDGLAR